MPSLELLEDILGKYCSVASRKKCHEIVNLENNNNANIDNIHIIRSCCVKYFL